MWSLTFLNTQETAKRIEEAGMEVAWDTARRKLALKKLKAFFLDSVCVFAPLTKRVAIEEQMHVTGL
jgi:hypothetical protein